MKSILFITTNKHKVEEINAVLKEFDIAVEQKVREYAEDKETDMEEIAKRAAKELSRELGEPLIMEDTGLFFKSYSNFPGAQPKFVYKGIGYDGIFRLLDGKDRSAYFKTVIGYCEPGSEPVCFEGTMEGQITSEVFDPEADAMPYDRIFIPTGYTEPIVRMDLIKKNSFSQRGKAARQLGEYLSKK